MGPKGWCHPSSTPPWLLWEPICLPLVLNLKVITCTSRALGIYLFVYLPPDMTLSTQPTVGPLFGTRKRLEEKTLVIRVHSFEVLN